MDTPASLSAADLEILCEAALWFRDTMIDPGHGASSRATFDNITDFVEDIRSGLLPGLKSGDVRNAVLFLNVFVRSAPFPRNTAPHRALRDRLAALLES